MYYSTLLNHLGTDEIVFAVSTISLPSIIPLLQKPEYFDVHPDDLAYFNLLFIVLFSFGHMIAGFSNAYVARKTHMSYTRLFLRVIIIGSFFLTFYTTHRY